MNTGWIKLHRVLLENPLIARSQYLAVFVYILLSLNHSDRKIIFNGLPFVVHAGSGIFSQLKMSTSLKIPRRTVARALQYLKSAHVIEFEASSRFTLIRARNWQRYQEVNSDGAHPARIQGASGAHLARTNKNEKNGKNDKNPHEGKKSFQKMLRWIEGMEGKIVHPKKYVTRIFDSYPESLIERCLRQSNCTSLMMFSQNMRVFQKEAERRQMRENSRLYEHAVDGRIE